MRKLLFIFLIMPIVFCEMAYANDYDVDSTENAIGISELQGKTYLIFIWNPVPYFDTFSFEEAGNFITGGANNVTDYLGSYTQTGNTFKAHTEWGPSGARHMDDYEGANVFDIFIFGISTTYYPNETSTSGFFFGILKSIR